MQEEIVTLCNRAFANYFLEVSSTQHAIADREWNPLNRALIFKHRFLKEILLRSLTTIQLPQPQQNIFTGDQSVISPMTSEISVASISSATRSRVAQTFNLKCGLAGTIITDLLQYVMKEEGVNENPKKRYAEGNML